MRDMSQRHAKQEQEQEQQKYQGEKEAKAMEATELDLFEKRIVVLMPPDRTVGLELDFSAEVGGNRHFVFNFIRSTEYMILHAYDTTYHCFCFRSVQVAPILFHPIICLTLRSIEGKFQFDNLRSYLLF